MGSNAFAFFILSIVSVLDVMLGVVVFKRAQTVRLYRLFFFMTVWMGLWTILNGIYGLIVDSPDIRYAIALLSYGAAAGLAISFLYFTQELSSRYIPQKLFRGLVVSTSIIGLLAVVPGLVANGVSDDGKIVTNVVPLSIYGLGIIAVLSCGIFTLIHAVRTARGSRKASYRILLSGLAIGVIIGVIFNLVLPYMGNYDYVQLGPVGLLMFVVFSTYAIVRHGLFDIRLAFVRTLAYGLSARCHGRIIFRACLPSIANVLPGCRNHRREYEPCKYRMALILAFIFQPIKHFFDHITNQIFYRDRYNSDEFIERLGEVLISTTQLRKLLKDACTEIGTTSSPHTLHLSSTETTIQISSLVVAEFLRSSEEDRRRITELLKQNGQDTMIVEEQNPAEPASWLKDKVLRMLERHNVSHGLATQVTARGIYCSVSKKVEVTTVATSRLLETISGELLIAIQNARSVQEVQDINTHLEQRIDKATANCDAQMKSCVNSTLPKTSLSVWHRTSSVRH